MPQYIVLDCKKCAHYTVCKIPCVYVDTLADGNKERVEPLVSNMLDDTSDIPASRDYNSVIADILDDRASRIEQALDIHDHRIRAIAALLLAGLSRSEVVDLLHVSYRTLSRLISNNRQLRAIKRVKMA